MQVQEQDVTQEEAAAMSRGGADIVAGQKYWSQNRVGNHRDTFKDETPRQKAVLRDKREISCTKDQSEWDKQGEAGPPREVRIQNSKEQGELRKGESAKSRGYEGDTDAKAEAGLQAEERKRQGEGNERDSEPQEWVTEGECTYATWCTLKP
ncbi:hypothetical protein B0H13DRAFT_1908053 [Mycena leptocephala]|nr:hypothetical protein B0H13DRAFT_1908053 [Mycena leptocephala]